MNTEASSKDAAQRIIDYLARKNIRIKRADALELLARAVEAPNWNVLQGAMRAQQGRKAVRLPAKESVTEGVTPALAPVDVQLVPQAVLSSASTWACHDFFGIAAELIALCQRTEEAQTDMASRECWRQNVITLRRLHALAEKAEQGARNQEEVLERVATVQEWLNLVCGMARAFEKDFRRHILVERYAPDYQNALKLYAEFTVITHKAAHGQEIVNECRRHTMQAVRLKRAQVLAGTLATASEDSPLKGAADTLQNELSAALELGIEPEQHHEYVDRSYVWR